MSVSVDTWTRLDGAFSSGTDKLLRACFGFMCQVTCKLVVTNQIEGVNESAS